MPARRRAAVLGRPIAHSRSPVLHRAAYRALGLDWTYDAVEIGEGDLSAFLDSLDDSWIGLSLTMPLKVAVIPLLDWVTADVEATGAANTVVLGPEGTRTGYNTDIHGITTAIEQAATAAGLDAATTGAVIGSGATARSTVLALHRLGVGRLWVTARRPEAADEVVSMAESIGSRAEAIPWSQRSSALAADVVVSTLPGDAAAPLADEIGASTRDRVLLDVTYHPWPTALARAWQAAGGVVTGGFDMLLWQACEQVRLMTGRPAPVAAMREALAAARSD